MISSPGEVIAAYLVSKGLGVRPAANQNESAWPITVTVMPSSATPPNNRIIVSSPDFESHGVNHRTGEQHGYWIVQIRTRSKPAGIGSRKIQAIMADLSALNKTEPRPTVTTDLSEQVTIVSAVLQSGPVDLGQEETNQQQHYAMTYKVSLVPGV